MPHLNLWAFSIIKIFLVSMLYLNYIEIGKIKVVLPIIPKGNPHSSHFHSSFLLFKSSSLICFSKLPSSLHPSYPLMTNYGDSC